MKKSKKSVVKEVRECADHASNPNSLGYGDGEEECGKCIKEYPEYAGECKRLTELRNPTVVEPPVEKEEKMEKKEKSEKYIDTGKHKFLLGSVRGDVAGWINEGLDEPTIVGKLIESKGYNKTRASSKYRAVKKIMEAN